MYLAGVKSEIEKVIVYMLAQTNMNRESIFSFLSWTFITYTSKQFR